MPYWTHSDGTQALWFKEGRWRIGPKSDRGTTMRGLESINSPLCPESVGSNWKYSDGEQFLDAQGSAKMYKYEGMIFQGNNQFKNRK